MTKLTQPARSRFRRLVPYALVLSSFGCMSSEPVDLGDDTPKSLGAALSDYAGSWDGYAEAYKFDDGTDRVRLQLAGDGSGSLLLGEANPPAEPDPDNGYPPDSDSSDWMKPVSVIAGFSYPIEGAAVKQNRIRFGSHSSELHRQWCSLQTPFPDDRDPDYYACLPNTGFSWVDDSCTLGDGSVVHCGKLACRQLCECTQDECHVLDSGADIEVDAALEGDGDDFVGTLVLLGERVTVRLTRM